MEGFQESIVTQMIAMKALEFGKGRKEGAFLFVPAGLMNDNKKAKRLSIKKSLPHVLR